MGKKITFRLTTVTEYTVDSDWYDDIEEGQEIIDIESSLLEDSLDAVFDVLSENEISEIKLEEVLE